MQQQAYDLLTFALAWCKQTAPATRQLEGEPQDIWYYRSWFDELAVKDSILCLRTPVGNGPESARRAIVPRVARQEILELAHGSQVDGHCEVQKTVEKLRQRFHWLKIAKDVNYSCENCQTCNRHKTHQRNRGALTPIYTEAPFERVAMEIVGPLPRRQRGNRSILRVVDHFTKHVEALRTAGSRGAFNRARVPQWIYLALWCLIYYSHGPTRKLWVTHVQIGVPVAEHQNDAHITLQPAVR